MKEKNGHGSKKSSPNKMAATAGSEDEENVSLAELKRRTPTKAANEKTMKVISPFWRILLTDFLTL